MSVSFYRQLEDQLDQARVDGMFKEERILTTPQQPEVSVAGLALRHGVNANQLRSWMKLEHWQSSPNTLLPVTVVADARPAEVVATTNARQPTQPKGVMEIEVGGTVIRLRGPVDTEQLKAVLAVVRA